MTGRYLIYTPWASWQDQKRFDANWHKFLAVCRSLDRDGLTYDVQFNLTSENPHVLITACGTAKRSDLFPKRPVIVILHQRWPRR